MKTARKYFPIILMLGFFFVNPWLKPALPKIDNTLSQEKALTIYKKNLKEIPVLLKKVVLNPKLKDLPEGIDNKTSEQSWNKIKELVEWNIQALEKNKIKNVSEKKKQETYFLYSDMLKAEQNPYDTKLFCKKTQALCELNKPWFKKIKDKLSIENLKKNIGPTVLSVLALILVVLKLSSIITLGTVTTTLAGLYYIVGIYFMFKKNKT